VQAVHRMFEVTPLTLAPGAAPGHTSAAPGGDTPVTCVSAAGSAPTATPAAEASMAEGPGGAIIVIGHGVAAAGVKAALERGLARCVDASLAMACA
jgi:hypothetical protein